MFSIGQMSDLARVKVPTIRYYEEIGLLDTPERSAGNQRRYDKKGLERLGFIRHARDLGLSLDMIRDLIALGQDETASCQEAHEIAARHAGDIRDRIEDLQRLEQELNRIASANDDGIVGSCLVLDGLLDHSKCSSSH